MDIQYRIMTAKEYSKLKVTGWHLVNKDVDGFGGHGVSPQFEALLKELEELRILAVNAGEALRDLDCDNPWPERIDEFMNTSEKG